MLTWSLACAGGAGSIPVTSAAITSLAFMFVEVPEPVWKTSIGNCASCLPAAISLAAFSIFEAVRFGSIPSSPLTAAAAPFTRASQRTTDTGTVSPEIGKLATALAVSPPQSCLSVIESPCARFAVRASYQWPHTCAWVSAHGDYLSTEGDKLARDPHR